MLVAVRNEADAMPATPVIGRSAQASIVNHRHWRSQRSCGIALPKTAQNSSVSAPRSSHEIFRFRHHNGIAARLWMPS